MKLLHDQGYELDFRDLYKFHNNIWITRNHDEFIPLADMTSSHIENIIALIDVNGPTCCYGLGPIWVPKLEKELKRRNKEDV